MTTPETSFESKARASSSFSKMPTKSRTNPAGFARSSASSYGRFTRAIACRSTWSRGSDSHLLEALDAQTGEPAWSRPVGARLLGSPTVIGEVVVYGAEDFRVYTLDAATGLGLSMEFTEGAIYSSVVPVAGLVLAGSDDHHLYAFKTRPAVLPADAAPAELLRALEGRYRTEAATCIRWRSTRDGWAWPSALIRPPWSWCRPTARSLSDALGHQRATAARARAACGGACPVAIRAGIGRLASGRAGDAGGRAPTAASGQALPRVQPRARKAGEQADKWPSHDVPSRTGLRPASMPR